MPDPAELATTPAAVDAAAFGADGAGTLQRALWATRLQFACLGLVLGAWGAHVPSAKARFALDEAQLSLLLLAAAAGTISCLFLAGRSVAWLGVRGAALASMLLLCIGLGSVLVMPNLAAACVAMLLFGAASSLFDMAINAEGSALETLGGRPVMSGLHAMFSVGGMLGAAANGALLQAGVEPAWQLAGTALATALLSLLAVRRMLPAHPQAAADEASFAWPRGPLLLIGLLILAGMTCEGVMYDWSVLYMKQELGQPQGFATLAYTSFAGAMALARFGGDSLRARVPARRLLGGGSAIAAVAVAVALLAGNAWLALVGFAIAGAGLANVAPVLFAAATRVPGVSRAAGLAAATSIGYGGFMLGPPLIGGLALATNLTMALGVLVIAAVLLALGARSVPA